MNVTDYISEQDPARQPCLTALHILITDTDKRVTIEVGYCLRNQMIIYKLDDVILYMLGSGRNYMSLHVFPIYGDIGLRDKYVKLLPKAKFQKACINFQNEDQLPLDIVKQLITDCAKVNWKAIWQKYKKK